MSWIPDRPSETQGGPQPVQPLDVLYYYDGPAIFTASVGFIEALFYKFGERDDSDLFLAVPLHREIVKALKDGVLSLRGALLADQAWIVETRSDLSILRLWSISNSEFPVKLLPARRTGIRPGLKNVADSLDAAHALFALTFQGASLGREGMPLGTFRSLIDNAHDAARRILTPHFLAGVRRATIDFQISEPKFSSLVLALKEPLIDWTKVKRRLKRSDQQEVQPRQASDIAAEIGANSTAFVQQIDEIATSAARGEISSAIAAERFSVLDQVSEIVPSGQNQISELAIASNVAGNRIIAVISIETGEKILRARRLAETQPVTDQGIVIQVNGKRNTILIQSNRGREVTCTLDEISFRQLHSEGRLDIGVRIRVTGPFKRRSRRDLIDVSTVPKII